MRLLTGLEKWIKKRKNEEANLDGSILCQMQSQEGDEESQGCYYEER
jgi:hypothetical protein